jgi:hypothetical protein
MTVHGIDNLRDYLITGAIETRHLEKLLANCWDEFSTDHGGMTGYKLLDRMEKVKWESPLLRFQIERHGATVLGSTRAEVQVWTLDLDMRTAKCALGSYRQLRPSAPRLNVQPLADEIFQIIRDREEDERLKWNEDGSVHVIIGKIIPEDGFGQTVAGRRKRFRSALDDLISAAGGERITANLYRLP